MANALSAPCGEIDILTVDAFRDCIYKIIDRCDTRIVRVDLHAVTFMSSTGYHALIDANEYATRHGHILTIRNLSAQCAIVLGICDWDNELHIEGLASASN